MAAGEERARASPADYIFFREGWQAPSSWGGGFRRRHLYGEISDRKPDPRSYGNAVAQHFVVEDTEKYCSVIDAAPSKDLKVLGQRQGYGSRAQAETALKGLNCKALPG